MTFTCEFYIKKQTKTAILQFPPGINKALFHSILFRFKHYDDSDMVSEGFDQLKGHCCDWLSLCFLVLLNICGLTEVNLVLSPKKTYFSHHHICVIALISRYFLN